MTDTNPEITLMAPAGSFDSLTAAIQGGADAVYFGVGQLNMRARSSHHFTVGDLAGIAARAGDVGLESYLALNTIIYDEEMEMLREILDAARQSGINAVIVSDQSAIRLAHEAGLPVHLSTQLNISNIETVKFYAPFADVMVLARELNLAQTAAICRAIREEQIRGPSGNLIRIELFAHGALCMAVSGKCYLSLHQYGQSANRGSCLQACRRSYEVQEKETGKALEIDNEYIMSPKDLCTIGFLDRILNAGVEVLKIEGRARGPEYVRQVSRCYREAIDAVLEGTYGQEKIKTWEHQLSEVFNRGFWDGYYLGQELGEWNRQYGSSATKRKIYLARGIRYFSKLGVGEFKLESGSLKRGEEVMIMGPTTGVLKIVAAEIQVDHQPVEQVEKGTRFSIPVPARIRPSDKLYKWVDASQIKIQ